MSKTGVFLSGSAVGFFAAALLAVGTGVLVVNLLLPWEEICATIGPLQVMAREGQKVITALVEWLEQAEGLLAATVDVPSNLGGALSGILDRAGQVTGDALSTALDVLTAPLQALIDLAKATLLAVGQAVEAAENTLASVDQARCN